MGRRGRRARAARGTGSEVGTGSRRALPPPVGSGDAESERGRGGRPDQPCTTRGRALPGPRLGGRPPAPGVWGIRNPVEWSRGPGPFHLYSSPPGRPSDRGPPGSAYSDVGQEERGRARYRVWALAALQRRIPLFLGVGPLLPLFMSVDTIVTV